MSNLYHSNEMPKSWILFLVLFLCTARWSDASIALPTDPTRNWKMISTQHFEIIYDENQRDLAKKMAIEAERAHVLVTQFLKTEKTSKTPIVIEDTTDNTNGFAQAIPYAQIHVYPALPMANDAISEYEDWIRELIIHEYTHIINFEPTSGIMSVFRTIFGGIVRPAGLLPRWYSEGLAVESESRHTVSGRGKSSFYSGMVRADVLGGTWGKASIDQLNEPGIPTWPRGLRPYGYGYFLMHDLGEVSEDGKSSDIYSQLNQRYGGRVPFFINGPVEDLKGKDYSGLLDDTYKKLDRKAKLQIEHLKTLGLTPTKRFNEEGFNLVAARISPDQKKLAFLASRYDEDPTLRILERSSTTQSFAEVSGGSQKLFSADIFSGLDWSSDSQQLIFGQTKTINRYNEFYDLFELDIKTKKTKRLTSRLRAHQGTWSEFDGKKYLVFVQNGGARSFLAECSQFPCQTANVLVSHPVGHRIASPRARGSLVVFSHRDTRGREWLESFDLKTKKLTQLTEPKGVNAQNFPLIQKNGAILFADNSSGVMNIYSLDQNKLSPLTNTTTYVTAPEYDEATGELIVSELTEKGFVLSAVAPKTFFYKSGSTSLAKIEGLSKFPPPPALTDAPTSTPISKEKSYSGLGYLWPQYLFPFFYSVPGGSLFEISTSMSDPLTHHNASISIGYDTRTNKPREAIQYTYGGLPFLIDVGFVNQSEYLSGLQSTYDTTDIFLGTRHFIAGLSNNWMMGPSFVYSRTMYPARPTENLGGMAYNVSYSDIGEKKDHMVSAEKGGSFSVSQIYYPKEWATTSYGTTKAMGNIYLSPGLFPKRHVFFAQVSGQYTPEQRSILVGSAQAGGELLWSIFPGIYNVRGYPIGEFLGWSLATGNFEYRFPLAQVFAGPGTLPVFQNNWHAALVYDVVTLKGGYFDSRGFLRATDVGTFYSSAGVEIRTDLKLFYFLPLTVKLGVHYGFSNEAQGATTLLMGAGASL